MEVQRNRLFQIFLIILGTGKPKRCDTIERVGDEDYSLWKSPTFDEVGDVGRILYELDCFRRDDCRSPRPVEIHGAVPRGRPVSMGCRDSACAHSRTNHRIAVSSEMLSASCVVKLRLRLNGRGRRNGERPVPTDYAEVGRLTNRAREEWKTWPFSLDGLFRRASGVAQPGRSCRPRAVKSTS